MGARKLLEVAKELTPKDYTQLVEVAKKLRNSLPAYDGDAVEKLMRIDQLRESSSLTVLSILEATKKPQEATSAAPPTEEPTSPFETVDYEFDSSFQEWYWNSDGNVMGL